MARWNLDSNRLQWLLLATIPAFFLGCTKVDTQVTALSPGSVTTTATNAGSNFAGSLSSPYAVSQTFGYKVHHGISYRANITASTTPGYSVVTAPTGDTPPTTVPQ